MPIDLNSILNTVENGLFPPLQFTGLTTTQKAETIGTIATAGLGATALGSAGILSKAPAVVPLLEKGAALGAASLTAKTALQDLFPSTFTTRSIHAHRHKKRARKHK